MLFEVSIFIVINFMTKIISGEIDPWSSCTATCGPAYKSRLKSDCKAPSDCIEIKICNLKPCSGIVSGFSQ